MKKLLSIILPTILLSALVSCAGVDNNSDSSSVTESSAIEYTAQGKIVVTVGMPGKNQLIIPVISKFNNSQDKYELKIVDYSEIVGEETNGVSDRAVNQLNLDIAAGKAPDIIAVAPTYMSNYIQNGMFADMYSLMDEYGSISKDDFLPNVIEGFEVDGKIPAISPNFDIGTAVAKKEFVGDAENWTFEDLVALCDSLPEGTRLLDARAENAPEAICDFITGKLYSDCVDLKNYSCDFSNPTLVSALDFVQQYAQDSAQNYQYDTDDSFLDNYGLNSTYATNRTVVRTVGINGFEQGIANQINWDFGGEDITYVGYPSTDGCGAVTGCRWMYGISENSPVKEGAWDFIEFMLTDEDYQHECNEIGSGLPVLKKFLDEYFNYKDTDDPVSFYYLNKNENLSEEKRNIPVTDEKAQQLYDYILSVDFDPYSDYTVSSIVDEECQAVVSGEHTGSECIEALQTRIEVYLSEKK